MMAAICHICKHDPPRPDCRLCQLYGHDPRYRQRIDRQTKPAAPTRLALDCFHLGKVLDRLDCNCQWRWVRACALHGQTTLRDCQACPDYQAESAEVEQQEAA